MKNDYNYIHYCPLRDKNIDDDICFDTVMSVLRENAKSDNDKIRIDYPNCEKVCSKCEFNLSDK